MSPYPPNSISPACEPGREQGPRNSGQHPRSAPLSWNTAVLWLCHHSERIKRNGNINSVESFQKLVVTKPGGANKGKLSGSVWHLECSTLFPLGCCEG